MNTRKITIAVDGHSSCGKSTLAKAVAAKFSYKYIDSGAMYRAVTLYAMNAGLIDSSGIKTDELQSDLDAGKISIDFRFNEETKKSDTFLNDSNVENEIRGIDVSNNVSLIAELKFVRTKLVALQQKMGVSGGIVMDGRDIGTVVFPDAELKIFLTAPAQIRAQRRFLELKNKGEDVNFGEILQNVEMRDKIDSTRAESPLIQADDAVVIDNGNLTIEQQNELTFKLVEDKISFSDK